MFIRLAKINLQKSFECLQVLTFKQRRHVVFFRIRGIVGGVAKF